MDRSIYTFGKSILSNLAKSISPFLIKLLGPSRQSDSKPLCTYYVDSKNHNPNGEEPFVEEVCACNCGHEFDYLVRCPHCGNTEWRQSRFHSMHGAWDFIDMLCLCCNLVMSFRLEDPYHPRWDKVKKDAEEEIKT